MLCIEVDGQVDWLGRCVAKDAVIFDLLRRHLLSLQAQHKDPHLGLADPAIQWTIERLYERLPSLLGEKILAADALWEHPDLVISLFWGPTAEALKELEVPEQPKTETDFQLEDPSSGDALADLFATLIGVDGTVDGARTLMAHYSIETLGALTRQLKALRKPEKERLEEAKSKYLEEVIKDAKDNDPALYHQIMGLETAKPL